MQRELISSLDGSLYSWISPHVLESSEVFGGDRFIWKEVLLLHDCWQVCLPEASILISYGAMHECTYRSILIFKINFEFLHRIDAHPQAVEDIVEDDHPPFLLLVLGEAIFCVYQSHLLQDRRLAALPSSYISSRRLVIGGYDRDLVGGDELRDGFSVAYPITRV